MPDALRRMDTRSRRLRIAGVGLSAAAVLIGLAACSSSGTSAGASNAPVDQAGLSAAEALTHEYTTSPVTESVGISVPLKAKPAPHFAILLEPGAAGDNAFVNKGFVQAMQAVGWKEQSIFYDNTNPAAVNDAVLEAIAKNPSYIGVSGVPISNYENALGIAKKDGIPVFDSLTSQTIDPSQDIVAVTGGTPRWVLYGQELADYAIATFKGHVHAAFFNLGDYPSINQELASEQAEYQKNCPKTCTINVVPISIQDLNQGKQPGLVVSYLESHPDTNTIDMATGGQTPGLYAALREGGYGNSSGGLKSGLITECGDPQSADLKAILAGQETMCVGLPSQMDGWYIADAMLRYSEGMSVMPSYTGSVGPSPILTKTTLAQYEPNIPPSGPYTGPSNYSSLFTALWDAS
jgi:ABC-type sugar transport system substrate-binding protein